MKTHLLYGHAALSRDDGRRSTAEGQDVLVQITAGAAENLRRKRESGR